MVRADEGAGRASRERHATARSSRSRSAASRPARPRPGACSEASTGWRVRSRSARRWSPGSPTRSGWRASGASPRASPTRSTTRSVACSTPSTPSRCTATSRMSAVAPSTFSTVGCAVSATWSARRWRPIARTASRATCTPPTSTTCAARRARDQAAADRSRLDERAAARTCAVPAFPVRQMVLNLLLNACRAVAARAARSR